MTKQTYSFYLTAIQSHKVKSKKAYITFMLPLMSDFTGAKAVGPKTSGQEQTINIENYK